MTSNYDLRGNVKEQIFREELTDPWIPGPTGDIILGPAGQQSEAHLGVHRDHPEIELVQLRYRSKKEKEHEAIYLRLLSSFKGIPRMWYESGDLSSPSSAPPSFLSSSVEGIIVTERLYEIPPLPFPSVMIVGCQMIDLIETLHRHGIYNDHIEYFTYHDGKGQIYFIDNRLWGLLRDNPIGTYLSVTAMILFLRKISDANDPRVTDLFERLKNVYFNWMNIKPGDDQDVINLSLMRKIFLQRDVHH